MLTIHHESLRYVNTIKGFWYKERFQIDRPIHQQINNTGLQVLMWQYIILLEYIIIIIVVIIIIIIVIVVVVVAAVVIAIIIIIITAIVSSRSRIINTIFIIISSSTSTTITTIIIKWTNERPILCYGLQHIIYVKYVI